MSCAEASWRLLAILFLALGSWGVCVKGAREGVYKTPTSELRLPSEVATGSVFLDL